MLTAEEENEAEVRREDQDNINKFARLNAQLHDVKAEQEALKVSEKTRGRTILIHFLRGMFSQDIILVRHDSIGLLILVLQYYLSYCICQFYRKN